ncbi:uncharacterized protein LOC120254604 [Dioscorea cayenensis subsp. rotundata]|uniref:Uncharacterized protein LOC120254604 n=1 Tax=Dioscorea cayennensis subsp. rotundata TaxID=55577 RepID=A0AB40AUG3_DIOCR|nr:uncharacterized protein LOC120254604 [Dioscorea cayenensis subsp. rotundata]
MDMIDGDSFNATRITILAATFAITLLLRSKRRRICREPSRARAEIREKYLSRLIDGNDTTSINMVRHNQRNRVIAHNFLRSGETVSRYFNHVLYAIGQLRDEYVLPPSTQTPAWNPYPCFCSPAFDVAAFRGRKAYPTQNVLAAIDFNLRFTYVLAGWEGSTHDALVLRDALERPNGLSGKYYLVDAGYSTRPGFISPYRGVRYHLKEFGSRTPTNHKELFNLRHSSASTTIERAFGSLKGRFKVLSSRPFFPFKTQAELVLATCILHNYIISGSEDILIPFEEEWIPQQPQSESNIREQREEAQEWVARREQIACDMRANK